MGGDGASGGEALPLSEYEVLSAEAAEAPGGEVRYAVREKGGEGLLWWRARRWSSRARFRLADEEARRVADLSGSCRDLLRLHRVLWHSASSTLYAVTEHTANLPLGQYMDQCRNGSLKFRRNFLWKVLHRAAHVCEALQSLQLKCWRFVFDANRIYVDSNLDLLFDPFVPVADPKNNDITSCPNVLCTIGPILYEMYTLKPYSKDRIYPSGDSKDLESMIEKLLHCNDSKCELAYNIILYHPTVLSHLDNKIEMFESMDPAECSVPSNDSAFESDESLKNNVSIPKLLPPEMIDDSLNYTLKSHILQDKSMDDSKISDLIQSGSIHWVNSSRNRNPITEVNLSPTLMALDLNLPGYVPRRGRKDVPEWKSRLDLCKEPEEVTEYALSKVWLDRLKTLQKKEEELKIKEREIAKQEIFNEVRSKILDDVAVENQNSRIQQTSNPGITIKTAMADKILCGENKNDSDCFPEFKDFDIELNCRQNPRIAPQKPLHKRPVRKVSSKSRSRKRMTLNYEDMDSSLSADPGDHSFLPTSSKMSSQIVPRPSNLCNNPRRKVHFNSRNNPFAEYDSISSTTFTFFDIENVESPYETPIAVPTNGESIADRISKFTYLDLEDLTNKKRELMERSRRSPMKMPPKNNSQSSVATFATKSPRNKLSRKTKYSSPRLVTSSQLNIYTSNNSESSGMSVTSYPCAGRIKDRRKSMPFLHHQNNSVKLNSTETNQSVDRSNVADNEIMTRSKSLRRSCRNAIFNNRLSLALTKKSTSDETHSVGKVDKKTDKENFQIPSVDRGKDKRKSILGFRAPFKLNI